MEKSKKDKRHKPEEEDRKLESKEHRRHSDHDRHRSHHRHAPTSSRSHHHKPSSSSSHRHENRSRKSKSPSPSRNDKQHYSRNCRKSKFDKRRSPSRESYSYHVSKKRRSKTPERTSEHNRDSCSKTSNFSSSTKIESCTKMDDKPANVAPRVQLDQPSVYVNFAKNNQEMKRKLLWGDTKKSTETKTSTNVWSNLQFQGERGTQMTEKFRKLMGIKNEDGEKDKKIETGDDVLSDKQATLFKNLDEQYSIARVATHTQRGVGLGFSNNRFL